MSNFSFNTGSIEYFLTHEDNDRFKKSAMVKETFSSGERVSFKDDMEALFTYKYPPEKGVSGTVVKVRTAFGDSTEFEGKVFVKWDNGDFGQFFPKDLIRSSNKKVASSVVRRVKTSMDLTSFFRKGSDLVHKATKDLWSFRQEGDELILERLFQDDGEPLKV